MHLPRGILHAFAATLTFTSVCAKPSTWDYEPQYNEAGTNEALSWGVHGKVWSKDHRHVQGWTLHGEGGWHPELHSDRIILTPPHHGNTRGGVWSENTEIDDEWETEFKFRASGPERGTGLFHMWYAANPLEDIKLASLYTVGKFDGLLLAIGQYQGKGQLRGFLNAKNVAFKDHHHVDALAFSSCDVNYKNTGHFIKVKVRQTAWTFEVEVDDKHCFQTHKLHLPYGYHFGLTAASAEIPDSFEVSSFITHKLVNGQKVSHDGYGHDEKNMHGGHEEWAHEVEDYLQHAGEHIDTTHHDTSHHDTSHHDTSHHDTAHSYSADDRGWYWTKQSEEIKDEPANHFKNEADRFGDLHDRLTLLVHQMSILFSDLTTFKKETEDRHEALLHYVKPLYDYAEYSKHQLELVKNDVGTVKQTVEDHSPRGHIEVMKRSVQDVHELAYDLHARSPRIGFLMFIFMAFQVMLLGSYVIYKRRMNSQPKKYL